MACVPDAEQLETEIYEVCYSGLPARIDRSSAATAAGAIVVPEVDDSSVELDGARVGLRSLSVAPAEGINDFGFVSGAHVDVGGRRILNLPGPGAELYGEAAAPPDLMPHTLGGNLHLTLVFEGQIAQPTWGVRIDACFSVDGVTVAN